MDRSVKLQKKLLSLNFKMNCAFKFNVLSTIAWSNRSVPQNAIGVFTLPLDNDYAMISA
jgi:hypothetical protein